MIIIMLYSFSFTDEIFDCDAVVGEQEIERRI